MDDETVFYLEIFLVFFLILSHNSKHSTSLSLLDFLKFQAKFKMKLEKIEMN